MHSCIVLSGDPMQLDAVTKSKYAKDLGFSTSSMEHLFKQPLYQPNPITKKFNAKYITQLVQNFRSHADILKVPNELFYENRLEAQFKGRSIGWSAFCFFLFEFWNSQILEYCKLIFWSLSYIFRWNNGYAIWSIIKWKIPSHIQFH